MRNLTSLPSGMALSLLLAATCFRLLCSCSVKEDRTGCLCWLDADISQCDGSVHLFGYDRGSVIDEVADPIQRPVCTYTVPKGMLQFSAVSGLEGVDHSGSTIACAPGSQFPKAGLYTATVRTSDEENVAVAVIPHKAYSEITFRLPEGMGFLAPQITIQTVSSSVGYDLTDGSVIRGEFAYSTLLDDSGSGSVRVPRQGYGDLKAIIYLDGKSFRTVDLYSELERRGFDWYERDLRDVVVEISVDNTEGEVVIGDWDPQSVEEE